MNTCPKADALLIGKQGHYQKMITDEQPHVFKHGYFSKNEAVIKTNKIYSEVNILT
jgi:hypothetical protein